MHQKNLCVMEAQKHMREAGRLAQKCEFGAAKEELSEAIYQLDMAGNWWNRHAHTKH